MSLLDRDSNPSFQEKESVLDCKGKKIGIFIIAYNAVNHLIKTISRVPKNVFGGVHEIFVIDDCSKDNSYYAALGFKHTHTIDKLQVYRNETNQGYGGNQKVGYNYAISQGFDIVALVHGDGQYAPEALANLLQPLINDEADMVFGSRMTNEVSPLKGGMPLYKYVGNRILTTVQNRLTGLNLSEYHSGYRLYNVHALKQIPFNSFTDNWHFDTQIILSLAERGFKIKELPIPTYYGDEICHVNGIPYAWNCFKTSLSYYRHQKAGTLMYQD